MTVATVAFDGRQSGYVPPAKLSISPKLKLQQKAALRPAGLIAACSCRS